MKWIYLGLFGIILISVWVSIITTYEKIGDLEFRLLTLEKVEARRHQ